MSSLQRPIGPHDIVLGDMLTTGRPDQFILTPRDQTHHATIWGRTGKGKSKLLQAIFLQHLSRGHGVCLLEPHHDLSLDTLAYLVDVGFFRREEAFDRLIYLDWGNGSFVPFNVLAKKGSPETVAMHTLEAMMRVWPELRRAPTFQTLWLSAMIVLIQNDLPLTYLYQLLTESTLRDLCLERVTDPLILQSFGTYDRTKGSVKDSGSILRRAFLISFHQATRLTLGQADSWIDIARWMNEGRSVIFNLGNIKDSETKRLIGALLLVLIEQATLLRADLPPQHRRPWTVLVDEWPSFTASDATIGNMLAQTRKYGLRLYLAGQSPSGVASDRLQAALENCGMNIVFQLGRDGAVDQARRLLSLDPAATKVDPVTGRLHRVAAGEQFEDLAQELQALSLQEAYIKLHDRPATKVRTLAVRDVPTEGSEVKRVLAVYRSRYQRTQEEVETMLGRFPLHPVSIAPQAEHFTLFSEPDNPDDEFLNES